MLSTCWHLPKPSIISAVSSKIIHSQNRFAYNDHNQFKIKGFELYHEFAGLYGFGRQTTCLRGDKGQVPNAHTSHTAALRWIPDCATV